MRPCRQIHCVCRAHRGKPLKLHGGPSGP
jgi:hypothetical protein